MGELCRAEVIVLGSGCAGLTAAIYLARAGLKPTVLEGDLPGGQLVTTATVENFPGFPDGIDGGELIGRMRRQAERFGASFAGDRATALAADGRDRIVEGEGRQYRCAALVVATGSTNRPLAVPGEREYAGRGVSFCATCDGAFFRGQTVAVVGGGDSAAGEALFLTRFCRRVYLVHRRSSLRASKELADRVSRCEKIIPVWERTVGSIDGDGRTVTGLTLADPRGERSPLPCDGVFVAVGRMPNTDFAAPLLPRDGDGYLVGLPPDGVATAVPGIFLAGDCCDRSYRQAIVAGGSGARAAICVERWLAENGR
jgi:thioredoxin reductase (NADPH)